MGLGSLKDLYLDELGDLYDAEGQVLRALPRFIEQARAAELKRLLTIHCRESRMHLERLDLIFTHWGLRASPRPCAGVSGIVQEADDRLMQAATPAVRDAIVLGAAQRIAHYEMAAYSCVRAHARGLNRPDEARLLQETHAEKSRAGSRLLDLADVQIGGRPRPEIRDASRVVPPASGASGRSPAVSPAETAEAADRVTPPHGDKLPG
jgi:ferritin-like metal-binding protein YciE